MKLFFAAALALVSATVTSATSGLRSGGRQLAPAFPPYNQQCRDDAGPAFPDDAETFGPGKAYHEGKPAFAVGDCPDPLKGACAQKSKTAAFLEGPVDCGGAGWFCRIVEEPGWPGVSFASDTNFGHCNTTEGNEDAGFDKDGHCHGSDVDETFYWWVRDHWYRQYNGRLRCCCGWDDMMAGKVVNRCDYRRLVTQDENLAQCRDANEQNVQPFNGGCSANANALNKPIPEDDSKCWEVQRFGEPNDDWNNDDDNNNNDNKCKDDSSFLFRDIAGRTCDWIGKKPNRIKNFCPQTSNGKKVSASCPVTCDACSGDNNDNDNECKDDSSYLYNGKRSCQWIGAKENRVKNLCPKAGVSEACPVTCDACSGNNNNNNNKCKDDSSFLYNGKRSCQWIGAKESRIDTFCPQNSGGKKVSDYCPVTCGECE